MDFAGGRAQRVSVQWDERRAADRREHVTVRETRTDIQDDRFTYSRPDVLPLLPPEWMCESLIAWQQIPNPENGIAPWCDADLLDHFPASRQNINSTRYAPHLYDRPAT